MSVPGEPRFGHGQGFSPRPVPVEPRFGHGLGFSPRSVPAEPRFGHGSLRRPAFVLVLFGEIR